MKKLLFVLTAIMCLSVVSVNAQSKGDMAAGVNLNLGFAYGNDMTTEDGGDFSNIGIGAKFQYNITDPIRLEAAFNKFLKKDYISMYDFMVNAHYLFGIGNLTVYPAVGLGVLGVKTSFMGYSASASEFGFNVGGGAELPISDKINLGAELKYISAAELNRLTLQFGATYKF